MELEEPLAPLERVSLRDGATRSLRQQIVAGTIQANRLYSIGDLATRLGTSPTPIREALLELEAQGLVELVRNRGFRVKAISLQDMREIQSIRVMLEVPTLQQLALMDPLPDLSDAFEWCERCTEYAAAGNVIAFLAADRDFHLSLISKLGNQRLTESVGNLRDQTRLYGIKHLEDEGLTSSAGEHPPLLDAICQHDSDKVGRLLRNHLGHVLGDWSNTPLHISV